MHQQRGPHCHQPHPNPAGEEGGSPGRCGGDLVPALHDQVEERCSPTQHSPWGRVPATPRCFQVQHPPHRQHTWPEDAPDQASPCWTLWISACSSGWDSAFSLRASSRAWFCEELATSVCRRRPSSSRIWASFWATCSPWGRNAGTLRQLPQVPGTQKEHSPAQPHTPCRWRLSGNCPAAAGPRPGSRS